MQESERVEQREDDLAVGTGAQRALGLAGRAGGVDHRRACLAGRGDVGFVREPARAHVVPREEATRGRHVTAEDDDRAQLRQPVAHRRHEWRLFGVDHDQSRVGVVDHVLHLVAVEPVGQRHCDEVALAGRVDRGDDLERVGSTPHEPFARSGTGREEAVGELVHLRVELTESGRRRSCTAARVDDDRDLVGRLSRVDRQSIERSVHGSERTRRR